MPLQKPSNVKKRVIVIGDSFAEGQGIVFEKSFAGLLKEQLKPNGTEVLNAAVSSYAPSVMYAKLKYLVETVGLEFDHVLAFIDVWRCL